MNPRTLSIVLGTTLLLIMGSFAYIQLNKTNAPELLVESSSVAIDDDAFRAINTSSASPLTPPVVPTVVTPKNTAAISRTDTPADDVSAGIREENIVKVKSLARDAQRISNIQQIDYGLMLYFEAHQKYPATLSLLVDENFVSYPIFTDPLDDVLYTYHTFLKDGVASYVLGGSLENMNKESLREDADITNSFIKGDDTQGCKGETGRHCYDFAS